MATAQLRLRISINSKPPSTITSAEAKRTLADLSGKRLGWTRSRCIRPDQGPFSLDLARLKSIELQRNWIVEK